MMQHMGWALKLENVPPAAKLLAVYIGDYYGCGPTDPRDGFTFMVDVAAKFCCVHQDEVDGLLKRIPGLVVVPRNGGFRQVWLPEEACK